jgi:hypothetical protein
MGDVMDKIKVRKVVPNHSLTKKHKDKKKDENKNKCRDNKKIGSYQD